MKRLFFPLVTLFFSGQLFAQQPAPFRIFCGNEVFHQITKAQYPALNEAFQTTFDEAKVRAQSPVTQRAPFVINVVVHVVWKNPAENIADSIIENQIAILNADYNRQNADTANLRGIFNPHSGSPDIQFNLAEIKRVQTTALFEVDLLGGTNLLAELKHVADGGSDAVDPDKYLNLWVCNIQPITIFGIEIGQILGFAFPPNDLANWPAASGSPNIEEDGVVIDYRMIGSNNPNTIDNPNAPGTPLTVKGRTATHEFGHYLGLRHIWGDGGALGGPNDCAQSDGIDDTPFASSQSNFDCDTTRNTCEIVEQYFNADMPDLIENYMDYSSESCMNMFTKGQAALMRSVLEGPRSGLVASSGTNTDLTFVPDWSIAPNPAHDYFRLNGTLDAATSIGIRIYSAEGRLMQEIPMRNYLPGKNDILINTALYPKGLYRIQIQTDLGIAVRSFVVQ